MFNSVTKAYEKLKSLLFDRSCNILQFNVSDKDMLIKLYKLLSDPTYDRGVFDEFLNIIVLTFAKEPVLFDTWGSIYSQFQPNNVTLSNSIVKEIKKQQTEYIKSKKYCPEGNCWEELDNDFLKNSFYTIMGTNEEHRNKSNDSEINEMHKNMRSILDKTAKAGRGDGGFFSGLLMKLLKRSALLVILISLALHIFDSVDTYNNAKSDGSRNIKLPAGHPVIPSDGGNINKCPYHQFRVKYTNCSQCHPVIKYVYDWMDEPYKYIESRAIIPAYEKVWKPYCSRAFMNGIQYGIVPAYKYSKPIIKEKVIQPIQKNVIPKAAVMYDTYAKDYVNTANENVFKPAYSTSSKYAKQAYTYLKPVTIKTKDYMINDVVKPSLPYLNKAKVRAIQYGNQFLDVLADIPYKKIMKNGASQTLRFIGATENNMEKLYVASTPYAQKYWEVLSRKSKAVMEQDNVQKIVGHPYVKTTTDAIKNIYNIWSEGTKVSYVYLTQRGPEEGGAKNWKEATDKVSIKKDIRNSIDFTKRFFKGIIEKLDREEEENIQNIQSSKVKEAKVKEANKEKEKEKRNNEEKKKEEKKKEEIPKEKIEKEAKKEKPEKKKEEVPKEKIEKEIPKEKPEKKKEEVPKEKIEKETKKEKLEKEASKKVIYDHINEQADSKKIAIEEAIIKEAKKSQESSSKKTAMEAAKTKESIKFRAKEVLKDQTKSKKPIVTESDAKQIAKEKAKIRSESKRIVKEEFQKNIAKKLAKEEARSKQTIKDHALEDTKQAVRDHYEETKKVAKDQAVKKVILKEEKQKTKQIAKERSQYTKEIAKEKNEAIKHAKEENKDNKE
ncbi:hypothetical protein BCR32DRAFT_42863 [Anaeromyces robustus]|uniref:Uncharacterized protein n=1 Tax=Anaeromyces robustus TaxID=1754192 RepID=A0A1Y1WYV9_9FUNG|nr:hypothetical protein BCR32DRAFT_42863 [Anaeromyces robustus]|eukprot:ORX78751.1 hypothetical protein BCR32DRAFT_42863 [Anaeromyces robustus]